MTARGGGGGGGDEDGGIGGRRVRVSDSGRDDGGGGDDGDGGARDIMRIMVRARLLLRGGGLATVLEAVGHTHTAFYTKKLLCSSSSSSSGSSSSSKEMPICGQLFVRTGGKGNKNIDLFLTAFPLLQ